MDIAQTERRRIVGVLLAEVGHARLAGESDFAERLDALALRIEHGVAGARGVCEVTGGETGTPEKLHECRR